MLWRKRAFGAAGKGHGSVYDGVGEGGGRRASLALTESGLYRGESVSHAAIWARVFQIKRSHKCRA